MTREKKVWGETVDREETGRRLESRHRIVTAAFVAVLVLSALTVVLSVGTRSASAAWNPPFRSLRIGIQAWTVTTFNPMKITLVDEYVVIFSTYSTLTSRDKAYHVTGDLAYSWSVAPDNMTWTFNLVHGAYFTDPSNPYDRSHPVTAADVVYTYNLQKNKTASIWWTYMSDVTSVSAVDPYTVRIVTDHPVATMYSITGNIPVMPAYIWSALKQDPMKYSPPAPIGSGGFYYDATNSSSSLAVLRKSPNYYASQYYCSVIRPDEVRFISYTNPTSMVSDFQSGANSLNALIGIDPTSYTQALAGWQPKWAVDQGFVGEYAINVMTTAERSYLVNGLGLTQFKTGSANQILATNWTVRRAIAMSINKTALIKDALYGLGNPADTLIPDSNPWHFKVPAQYAYTFNTALARQMLYAAGWKFDSAGNNATSSTYPLYQAGGTNPLIFRFYTLNTDPWWEQAALDTVTWLHQAGIQTTDRLGNAVPGYGLYGINQMSGYWLSADYDMWLWDWVFTPASDPSTDIMQVETSMAIGPTSDNFYSNATYDNVYNQSLVATNPAQRQQLVNQLQMMVYNYSSYILPFYKDDLYAATTQNPGNSGVAWQNWGNWSQYNGLTPDSDLMNLWEQVEPVAYPAPQVVSFPSVLWISGSAAPIGVTVNDPQSPTLNYSFDFGDGSPVVNTTTVPASHTYANPGNYTITLRVANAQWPVCTQTTAQILAPGSVNLPPQASVFAPSTFTGTVNKTVWFNLTASEPEGEPLYATFTFSDGTSQTTAYSAGNTRAGVTLSTAHVFTAAGTYKVVATVTDNQTSPGFNHSPSLNVTVTIQAAGGGGGGGGPPVNPLVNYGIPIVIVVVIVAAVVAVVWRRRNAAKKEEAETQEAPKESPPNPPPP